MKMLSVILIFVIISGVSLGQENPLERMNFILGEWSGSGRGFGNQTSKTESSFQYIMDNKYIEVRNESRFEQTEKKTKGEHHIDKGFISYDIQRQLTIFRQFNIEGYINQYVLNDSLSNDSTLVFETEIIENFVPGGNARWTIHKVGDSEIKTVFDVSFPGKEYSCYGTNKLIKK